MSQQLDVDGTLVLERDGTRVEVKGSGDVVNVVLPSLRAGSELRELANSSLGSFEGVFDFLRDLQKRSDVRIELQVGDLVVGTLDADTSPGLLSRLLGVAPFRIRLLGVLWAKLRGY
ncbi:MAG: hypothetical protein ACFCD0_15520 [Gemmataceae bacterium]